MKISSIGKAINGFGDKLKQGWKFATEDVWDIELTSLSAMRSFGVRIVRIITLVFKGFKDDECTMHASSLTFSTLMAIVPVLALTLSMAKGFGDGETAKIWIQDSVSSWTATFSSATAEPENIQTNQSTALSNPEDTLSTSDEFVQSELAARINLLVEQGFEKVDSINFAKLGTVGLILLIGMVISVLGRVESSFNRVWGITVGRSVWRRFTDYLSVLLILPILIAAAASMPVMDMLTRFMPEHMAEIIQGIVASGLFKNMVVIGMTSLVFAFLIMFMPNTKVKFRAGISGGFVTALLFILWLAICAWAQVGVGKYGKIYGSFAVVPILLAWVYMSWQIVLFGAEVAFAVQHNATYKMEQRSHKANLEARMTLALAVVVEAARSMVQATPPFEVATYAKKNRVPVRFLNAIIDELVQAGYLAQLSEKNESYALLKAPASLKITDVINVVMNSGVGPSALGLSTVASNISKAVKGATSGIDRSLQDATVETLLEARG